MGFAGIKKLSSVVPALSGLSAAARMTVSMGAGVLMVVGLLCGIRARSQVVDHAAGATADHIAASSWWPTKATAAEAFAGEQACAQCHSGEVRTQAVSAMAKAAFRGSEIAEAGRPARGSYREADQVYTYLTTDQGSSLLVTLGSQSVASPVTWIFGAGVHGQTYLLQHDGRSYEAQVSSFAAGQLGLTPGHHPTTGGATEPAVGKRLLPSEAAQCFACHNTVWTAAATGTVTALRTGVRCEACHGPGADHVAAANKGQQKETLAAIVNPGHFTPAMSIDFCGACHRTTMDVALSDLPSGLSSIRFQPYRLQKSRCWEKTQDERLTCVACHDPHGPLVHDAAFYDRKCLTCHGGTAGNHRAATEASTARAAVCPRASANCVSCHMPKYKLPEMQSQFTDHMIRVARAGEPFPN